MEIPHDWRVERKEVVREGAVVEVQEAVLEEAAQDAVEEVQGEVLQEVQIIGVFLGLWHFVLGESG